MRLSKKLKNKSQENNFIVGKIGGRGGKIFGEREKRQMRGRGDKWEGGDKWKEGETKSLGRSVRELNEQTEKTTKIEFIKLLILID